MVRLEFCGNTLNAWARGRSSRKCSFDFVQVRVARECDEAWIVEKQKAWRSSHIKLERDDAGKRREARQRKVHVFSERLALKRSTAVPPFQDSSTTYNVLLFGVLASLMSEDTTLVSLCIQRA